MKKTKSILLTSVTVVMALIMSLAVGCSGGSSCKKNPKDEGGTKTLQSITLDTSSVKKEYYVGEDLSTAGLVVKANYVNEKNEPSTENVELTDRNLVINTSAYNKNVAGTYTITVSYRYSNVTKSDNYAVNVMIEHVGLNVVLKSGVNDKLSLSAENETVDLSDAATWIEVRKPDKRGVTDMTAAPLDSSEYTVKVYLGKTELTTEQLKTCKKGAYQIWASMPYGDDYTLEAFTWVTVYDVLVGIEFKDGTTEQIISGADFMSPTWTYTASFVSGDTENLTAKDVTVTGLNPSAVNANGSATVSYTYKGIDGNITKTVNVPYVTKNLTGEVTYTAIYSAKDMSSMETTWDGLQGLSGQLTFGGSAKTYRDNEKSNEEGDVTYRYAIEVKDGTDISITLTGIKAESAKIVVYVSHATAGSAESPVTRTAYLKNSSGTALDSCAITGSGVAPAYLYTMTAEKLSSGTYSIDADATMRVYAVVVTYTVDYGNGN